MQGLSYRVSVVLDLVLIDACFSHFSLRTGTKESIE